MKKMTFLFGLSMILWCCEAQVSINEIENAPVVSTEDEQYADVYKGLDGTWEGVFHIYELKNPTTKNEDLLAPKDSMDLSKIDGLQLTQSIDVQQIYTSESPYFQRVEIKDFYPGSGKTVASRGVNKVQDGKMWCVVKKPDDEIIHKGSLDGPKTIIWERDEQNPQRIEYFRETVLENTYEIIGWGYYEGHDTSQLPKYWFYAKYHRQ